MRIGEISEKSARNKKVYRMSDGSEQSVYYPGEISTEESEIVEIGEDEVGDVQIAENAEKDTVGAEASADTPQLDLSGTSALTSYRFDGENVYRADTHRVGATTDNDGNIVAHRMYMNMAFPLLPRNPRIKRAELILKQTESEVESGEKVKLGLYRTVARATEGAAAPETSTELIDYCETVSGTEGEAEYLFDVTVMLDSYLSGEMSNFTVVMKVIDESTAAGSCIIGGSGDVANPPRLVITYETSYGVNSGYRTHSHEIGQFGEGSIDLRRGNLMFDAVDISWDGIRMPVTVKHLYNSALSNYCYSKNSGIKLNTADFSEMKIGKGYKLNIMQSMTEGEFVCNGEICDGYIRIGENGTEEYFKESTDMSENDGETYKLYEEVNGSGSIYDPVKKTLSEGGEEYLFDSVGRLVKITDENGNSRENVYENGRITKVIDGAGRKFVFGYNENGYLVSLTGPDDVSMRYAYTRDLLREITYRDGRKAETEYTTANKPSSVTLKDKDGNTVYKVKVRIYRR